MIAQSVSEIIGRHVRLSVEGIDRMYLNVYVPRLQSEIGVVRFFRGHRDNPLPSGALMSPMSRTFVAQLEAFADKHRFPVVRFPSEDSPHSRPPSQHVFRSRLPDG